MADPERDEVTLSLISHTNVGKTTLARTLLRRDIGDAIDQPHVTDTNTAYELIAAGDTRLVLWDTPGFGDTARLLKRLESADRPLGWVLTQVWDRFADRPLWCSQLALRNVREEADLVLYLVNGAEDPAMAGYVDMEMKILGWVGKPVVVLLNQTGPSRDAAAEAADEGLWRDHLAGVAIVREVLSLDAFTRCWVQELELMDAVARALEGGARDRFAVLRDAWRDRNLEVFHRSMGILAAAAAESLEDSCEVSEERIVQKIGLARGERRRELEAVRRQLAERLDARIRTAVNALIEHHSLEGESQRRADAFTHEHFAMPERVHASVASAVGGAMTGLVMGLAADLHAGGLTFGGGAVAGAFLGGAGSYALARGYNLARRKDNRVRWSRDHFIEQVRLLVLCYLAVAHFGRGRGAWQDAAYPAHWATAVDRVLARHRETLQRLWERPDRVEAARDALATEFTLLCREILEALYPEVDPFRAGAGRVHG